MRQDLAQRFYKYLSLYEDWVPQGNLIVLAKKALYSDKELEEAFKLLESAGEGRGYVFVNIGTLKEPIKGVQYRYYKMEDNEILALKEQLTQFDLL